ncbi:Maf family nucleotide pyrophosphatase [uncultured Desulfovibrio sp.]|uniref:Maf family nucleotide pyrophosphatase n=1 Tax=uncultured Desulfovibrio sp. TaxID=167968 RepID=UPI00263211C4|nr:Maf family nucleotide pyrophosphatase [uncultured Desulfovibrio sp.]
MTASVTAWPPLFALPGGWELVLASHSPRRRQFLEEWGLAYRIVTGRDEEPRPRAGEAPAAYARRAARAKALSAAAADGQAAGPRVLLAADTIVALGEDILGKPADRAQALEMLRRLAGRTHEVISAVCLLGPQDEEIVFHDVSRVRFAPWPEAVLAAYAATGEPDDKAGAYAIQGQGAVLVEAVDGSWSTVVGLPVSRLAQEMLSRGWLTPVGAGPAV